MSKIENTQNTESLEELEDSDFSKLTQHIKEVGFDEKEEEETEEAEGNESKEEKKEPEAEETEQTKEGTPLGKLLPASFVLNLTNIAIPLIIVLGFKLFGYKINKKEFQLTAAETRVLEEPLQAYLDYIKVNLKNPLYNLLLAISIVYGSKIIEAAEKAEKFKGKKKPGKEEATSSKETIEDTLDSLVKPDESWKEGFAQEQIDLITATRKRRNKSYGDAIEWLRKKGQL